MPRPLRAPARDSRRYDLDFCAGATEMLEHGQTFGGNLDLNLAAVGSKRRSAGRTWVVDLPCLGFGSRVPFHVHSPRGLRQEFR